MENLSDILTENGDCLLVVPIWSSVDAFWEHCSKTEKWSHFNAVTEYRAKRSVYYSSSNPANIIQTYLSTAGFNEVCVDERHMSFDFQILHNLRTFFFTENDNLNQLEDEIRLDLFNDFVEFNKQINLDLDESLDKFVYRYKIIVAYARKCF